MNTRRILMLVRGDRIGVVPAILCAFALTMLIFTVVIGTAADATLTIDDGSWMDFTKIHQAVSNSSADSSCAKFSFTKHFSIYTQDDSITSGIYDSYKYWMHIYNEDDDSDTVLGNLTYIVQAENITDVYRYDEYSEWDESYAKWEFPPEFGVEEDNNEEFVTVGFKTHGLKYPLNFSLNRWFNQTSFSETAYQLVNFSVKFEDDNFEEPWGLVNIHKHEEVYASVVPNTFETNAPIDWMTEWVDGIQFDFDEDALESGVTYNFSFVVKVEPTMPVIYKPLIQIGQIGYTNTTIGEIGYTAEMPSYMLDENVSYASVSTNISNAWRLERSTRLFAALGEVYESIVPKSEIHVHKKEYLSTNDTYIDHDKIYNFTTGWNANVWDVENLDNVTYTITTSENFTYKNNWELYPNGIDRSFILPPTIEGQNYTWLLPLKDRIGSEINFVLDSSQTVQDNPWADMDVSTTDENGYTRVNVTFTPIIPLDWINFHVGGNQIIDVSAYPPEFEIDMTSTSSYVRFDSGDITQDHIYNFSVLCDNPKKVKLWLDATFDWVEESPSDAITIPVAELGSVTVKADVPVIWEHRPTLPQYVQSITINMNGWLHDTSLLFAITPNSRLAQIGTPVTIFLSVINPGTGNATDVSIAQASGLPATVSYQPWDGAALTGLPDTPVDIPASEAAHFVLTINATAEFDSSPMTFNVSGTNAAAAPISSVNTLTMSASAVPYADIIMMSTSLDMGMTVNTAAAFVLATSNVGSADATGVSLIVDVPDAITGLVYQVNETNLDGSIKGPATGLTIPVGGQPTFAVFLTPTQAIDYDPANNRIVLKLVDSSGKVVGAQSVAVSTA